MRQCLIFYLLEVVPYVGEVAPLATLPRSSKARRIFRGLVVNRNWWGVKRVTDNQSFTLLTFPTLKVIRTYCDVDRLVPRQVVHKGSGHVSRPQDQDFLRCLGHLRLGFHLGPVSKGFVQSLYKKERRLRSMVLNKKLCDVGDFQK